MLRLSVKSAKAPVASRSLQVSVSLSFFAFFGDGLGFGLGMSKRVQWVLGLLTRCRAKYTKRRDPFGGSGQGWMCSRGYVPTKSDREHLSHPVRNSDFFFVMSAFRHIALLLAHSSSVFPSISKSHPTLHTIE